MRIFQFQKIIYIEIGSVADPDPGSDAFLIPGSGMENIQIRDEHSGSYFWELGINLFDEKYLNSLMRKISIVPYRYIVTRFVGPCMFGLILNRDLLVLRVHLCHCHLYLFGVINALCILDVDGSEKLWFRGHIRGVWGAQESLTQPWPCLRLQIYVISCRCAGLV